MKNLKYIKFVVLVLVLSSCEDFLEPSPTSVISSEDFYQNEQQLLEGVINMYDGLQGVNDTSNNTNHATQVEFYVTEMRSDNTRTKSGEGEAAQFDDFAIQPTNSFIADYYRSFFNVIFRANTVLANLDVASAATRDKIEAEAKFVRAHAYFNMVRLYGDLPLVDRLVTAADGTDIFYDRRPTSEIYDLIESDLMSAVNNLDNSGSRNRASKAAAQALLAKVYLTQNANYLEAQILLEDVMTSGYMLEPNFSDVFFNEANSEVIFSIGYTSGISTDSQNFSAEWLNGVGRTVGVNYATQDAVAALTANVDDVRAAVAFREDPLQPTQNQVTKYLPDGADGGDDGKTFSFDARLAGNDWIVVRYADVLLMHVEAILAGGQDTSVPAALNSFQLVRDRAGLTDPITNITKDDLLAERRLELAFENQRLFDLIRFNKAQEVLSAFASQNGTNFSTTDLLLPIPQREIGLSGGLLQQNPGY